MKYTTAMGHSRHGLDESVAELLHRGYVPCGGVCAIWTPGGLQFYQAMVRS
jgi:hypothetical protein